jgi:hypothetical protein
LVVVFLAAADLVVILVAFGLELRVFDAVADLVVVFFTAADLALVVVFLGVFPDAGIITSLFELLGNLSCWPPNRKFTGFPASAACPARAVH